MWLKVKSKSETDFTDANKSEILRGFFQNGGIDQFLYFVKI